MKNQSNSNNNDSMTSAATNFLEDPALMEPFTHVANLPSKNIRGYFVDAIAANLLENVPPFYVSKLQEATAILHSASLLFDDIEDGTKMRRGKPSAHVIFGMPLSLNSASAATCAALEVMLKSTVSSTGDNDDDDDNQPARSNNNTTMILSKQESGESAQNDHDDGESMSRETSSLSQSNKSSPSTTGTRPSAESYQTRQESQVPSSFISNSFNSRQLHQERQEQQQEQISQEHKMNQQQFLSEFQQDALSGRLTRVYIDNMKLLHSGQGKDIYWRDMNQCPSLAEYRLMARQKTGGLFRLVAMWALELDSFFEEIYQNKQQRENNSTRRVVVKNDDDDEAVMKQQKILQKQRNSLLLSLCDDFGLCFQILDDVSNLCDVKLHELKSFADDIDEGKFSYPAIHCILAGQQKTPQDKRLLHALSRKKQQHAGTAVVSSITSLVDSSITMKSDAEKEFCLGLMREAGSIDQSCEEILSLCDCLKKRLGEMVRMTKEQQQQRQQEEFKWMISKKLQKSEFVLSSLIDKMAEKAKGFQSK